MTRTITHKDGRTIETSLSDAQAVDRLRTAGQRGKFASSILEQYVTKGRLTDSQWFWVHKIALEKDASSKHSYVTVQGCQSIHDMFARAMARRLKTPKITFQFDDVSIVYYVGRRDRSRNQVAVYKVDGTWDRQGTINDRGQFTCYASADPQVVQFTKLFAANPAQIAMTMGHKSGRCCFCNRSLTTDESVAAGFGSTCAKRYNLLDEWKALARRVKAEQPGTMFREQPA